MGAYSSWAVFALSHHIIVRSAALMSTGNILFNEYALLGDDIVLTNPLIANAYKKIIKELGVDISEMKSHVSSDTYEFAKR
jgi:hypothetical protein